MSPADLQAVLQALAHCLFAPHTAAATRQTADECLEVRALEKAGGNTEDWPHFERQMQRRLRLTQGRCCLRRSHERAACGLCPYLPANIILLAACMADEVLSRSSCCLANVKSAPTQCAAVPVPQLICEATGETAAALLGPLTGALVGEALRRHGCRLLPVAAPAALLGHAAVITYCLKQRPALLPLSPVSR